MIASSSIFFEDGLPFLWEHTSPLTEKALSEDELEVLRSLISSLNSTVSLYHFQSLDLENVAHPVDEEDDDPIPFTHPPTLY